MKLPELTHLQFFVLAGLSGNDQSGPAIRGSLVEQGHKKSLSAFYQFMARLEDAGYVKGRYIPKEVNGYMVRERLYHLLQPGRRAVLKTSRFYAKHSPTGEKMQITMD